MKRVGFLRRPARGVRRAVRAAPPSGYLTYIKSARPRAAIEWGSLGSFCHAAQIAHSGSMSGWRRSCPTIRGRGASDDRHDQSHLRGLSGDVAKTGPHILGVDERILQPETGLRLGGSRRLCAKYRQYEAVLHILSHRDLHDGAQMGDREAKSVSAMPVSKKLYLPTVAACVALLAAPTIPARAQVIVDLSVVTCGQYMGKDRDTQDVLAAWMSSYFNAAKDQSKVDLARFERNRRQLKAIAKSTSLRR